MLYNENQCETLKKKRSYDNLIDNVDDIGTYMLMILSVFGGVWQVRKSGKIID